MGKTIIAIVSVGFGIYLLWIIFSTPIKEPYIETYYTQEPLTYNVSFVREVQVPTWIFWHTTEEQYIVTNTDTQPGNFTLTFIFSNNEKTNSVTRIINILAGVPEAITEDSPLWGVSSCKLSVTSSTKSVAHTRPATRDVYIWDHLKDLVPFIPK